MVMGIMVTMMIMVSSNSCNALYSCYSACSKSIRDIITNKTLNFPKSGSYMKSICVHHLLVLIPAHDTHQPWETVTLTHRRVTWSQMVSGRRSYSHLISKMFLMLPGEGHILSRLIFSFRLPVVVIITAAYFQTWAERCFKQDVPKCWVWFQIGSIWRLYCAPIC